MTTNTTFPDVADLQGGDQVPPQAANARTCPTNIESHGVGDQITDAQVEAYFRAKLSELQQDSKYACVSISLYGNRRFHPDLRCTVDFGNGSSLQSATSVTECIAKMKAERANGVMAKKLRDDAQRLLDQAAELEGGGE